MNIVSRALAIIGFVALVVIGMWGSVRIAQSVPGALSSVAAAIVSITSIFVPASETITLSVQSHSVLSGTPVAIAFTHDNKKVEGSYAFRYSCVEGISVSTASTAGTDQVPCNTPYVVIPFNNAISITPVSTANRFADVEVFIAFTPNDTGTATVIGSTVLTIENRALSTSPTTIGTIPAPTPAPTPKPKPVIPGVPSTPITIQVPTSRTSDPQGYTDLIARVIEIGTVDKTTGAFTASTTPSRSGRVAIRFAVENIGTKTSKEFAFNVVIPSFPSYTYFGQMQQPLGPGDRIEFTLGFDSFIDSTEGVVIINVDPTGAVNERNKDNNIVKHTMTVSK